jgi:hypothetical protein
MTSLSKETELDSEEVIPRATRFFGPDGTGLAICERSSHEVSFAGRGGYVTVHASRTDGRVTINLVANEWELHETRDPSSILPPGRADLAGRRPRARPHHRC